MAIETKSFDRMVRVEPERYQQASVVARIESMSLKDFVDLAIREAIERRQAKIKASFLMIDRVASATN